MTQGIKDKVVVITGASSGLGEATARLLSAQGAQALWWVHGVSIASSH
jgi:NADP-dependent 3-hydroxy acid dehydrogenase YdfG